ncbi:tellurite resistance TerB family protein [Rheinheimera sp.]|uniref:tellurite resistance TerB family protein n=1 Tax=Rheinheimera sp. TaxID=1869214 RepID=UPI002FDCAEA2
MNMKSLLNQLLGSGSDLVQGKSSGQQGYGHSSSQHSSSYGAQQQSGSDIGSQLSSLLSGKGGAALAGGALGLLLGSKSGRKMGGKVLTYGGLAALGALAFKAYQNYQQQQGTTAQSANPAQPLAQLPAPAQEAHSKAILVALIAAAKADGHIDAKERQLIDGEIAKISNDNSITQWFDAELQKPLDPAEIARYATDEAMASEMFLASVLVVDEENFMEKSYLQELARQLQLPPELQQSLRAQVAEVRQSLQ